MKRRKKRASFSPCLRQRCQGAMPRLMPSRAQRQLLVAHCMIWLVTAGRDPSPWPPSGLFSVNGGSFWSASLPARQKASPPSSYSIPSPTVPAVRGPNSARHLPALPFLALVRTSLGQSARRCLIAGLPSPLPQLWMAASCARRLCAFGARVVAKRALFMASMPALRLTRGRGLGRVGDEAIP